MPICHEKQPLPLIELFERCILNVIGRAHRAAAYIIRLLRISNDVRDINIAHTT